MTAKEATEYSNKSSDYEQLAKNMKITFDKGANILEHLEFLKKNQADIAVSINYTGIIPERIIDIYKLGILNVHGGDLPKYRGNAFQAWALLNGEEKIGLCIHKMIGGELDNGDTISRDYLDVTSQSTITDVWRWMNKQTPKLIIKAINQLKQNEQGLINK